MLAAALLMLAAPSDRPLVIDTFDTKAASPDGLVAEQIKSAD